MPSPCAGTGAGTKGGGGEGAGAGVGAAKGGAEGPRSSVVVPWFTLACVSALANVAELSVQETGSAIEPVSGICVASDVFTVGCCGKLGGLNLVRDTRL